MITWAIYMQLLLALAPQPAETSIHIDKEGRRFLDFRIGMTFPGVRYQVEESANGIHWAPRKAFYWGIGRPTTVRVPIESDRMFFRMTWEMPTVLDKVKEDPAQ